MGLVSLNGLLCLCVYFEILLLLNLMILALDPKNRAFSTFMMKIILPPIAWLVASNT